MIRKPATTKNWPLHKSSGNQARRSSFSLHRIDIAPVRALRLHQRLVHPSVRHVLRQPELPRGSRHDRVRRRLFAATVKDPFAQARLRLRAGRLPVRQCRGKCRSGERNPGDRSGPHQRIQIPSSDPCRLFELPGQHRCLDLAGGLKARKRTPMRSSSPTAFRRPAATLRFIRASMWIAA